MRRTFLLTLALAAAACTGDSNATANPNDPDMAAMPVPAPAPGAAPMTPDDAPSGAAGDVGDQDIPWRTEEDQVPGQGPRAEPAVADDEELTYDEDEE